MGNSTSSEWLCKYNEIKLNHDKAFHVIAEGLTLDEQQNTIQAIEKYKDGLNLIDEALNVRVSMPEKADYYWEEALRMIQKMKKTRKEIVERIENIDEDQSFTFENDTNDLNTNKNICELYADLAKIILEFSIKLREYDSTITYTYLDVKLFLISSEGVVNQVSKDQKLVIASLQDCDEEEGKVQYFIQLCSYIFPLIDGVCPCYKTDHGIYILPDVNTRNQGSSCIGLSLKNIEGADERHLQLLNNIFQSLANSKPTKKGFNEIDNASLQEISIFQENLKRYGKKLDRNISEDKVRTVEFQVNELANAFFSTDENIFGTLYKLNYITPEEMFQRHLQDTIKVESNLYPDLQDVQHSD